MVKNIYVRVRHMNNDNTEFRIFFKHDSYIMKVDLIKNTRKILKIVATRILYEENTTIRGFFHKNNEQLVEMIRPHISFEKDETTNLDDWEFVAQNVKEFTIPAGKYYVGDLCYEMKETIYDKVFGGKFGFTDGLYRRKSDGAVFGMFGTGGDGSFTDVNSGDSYCVDAGMLGIASSSLCYGVMEHEYIPHESKCWTGYSDDEDSEMYSFFNDKIMIIG